MSLASTAEQEGTLGFSKWKNMILRRINKALSSPLKGNLLSSSEGENISSYYGASPDRDHLLSANDGGILLFLVVWYQPCLNRYARMLRRWLNVFLVNLSSVRLAIKGYPSSLG
jgi:hypothetical protein